MQPWLGTGLPTAISLGPKCQRKPCHYSHCFTEPSGRALCDFLFYVPGSVTCQQLKLNKARKATSSLPSVNYSRCCWDTCRLCLYVALYCHQVLSLIAVICCVRQQSEAGLLTQTCQIACRRPSVQPHRTALPGTACRYSG